MSVSSVKSLVPRGKSSHKCAPPSRRGLVRQLYRGAVTWRHGGIGIISRFDSATT